MIAEDPLDSVAAFYITDQENIDKENNLALRLNAHVAKCLHGKKLDLSDKRCPYHSDANPLLGFQNHFNMSSSFTYD